LKDTVNSSNSIVTTTSGLTGHIATKFTSTTFDPAQGKLYTGC